MAQQDKLFTAFFLDSTTAPWTPITGLSATISIREVDVWTEVISNASMIELWGWHYKYTFAEMNATKDYVYSINPNSLLAYIESGVTDKRMNNIDLAISDIRWGWGGGYINISGIQATVQSSRNNIIEELKKELSLVRKEIKDCISAIPEVEFPEIEFPEVPEVDMSDITKWMWKLDKEITKISDFLRKEKDMEKKELLKENEKIIKEKEKQLQALENTFQKISKEYEDKINEKESDNDKLLEEVEMILKDIESKTEKEKKKIAEEIKNKILSSI